MNQKDQCLWGEDKDELSDKQAQAEQRERENKKEDRIEQMIRWSVTWRVELLALFKGSYRKILC